MPIAGVANNPLTKFPINNHAIGTTTQTPPGKSTTSITHTPVGPVPSTSTPLNQITPTTGRVTFRGFPSGIK